MNQSNVVSLMLSFYNSILVKSRGSSLLTPTYLYTTQLGRNWLSRTG